MQRWNRSAVAGLLVGMMLIAVVAFAVSLRAAQRPLATDITPIQSAVATLPPGARACQPQTLVAADAGALRIAVSVQGAGTRLRVAVPGRDDVAAALRAGDGGAGAWVEVAPTTPWAVLPLAQTAERDALHVVCVENGGPAPTLLMGIATGPELQAQVSGTGAAAEVGRARVDSLLAAGDERALTMIGRLPGRVAAATGSPLAPWLLIGGALLALVLLVALIARPADERLGAPDVDAPADAGGEPQGGGTATDAAADPAVAPSRSGRNGRVDLALLAALTLAVGAMWTGLTPLLQATDEQAHVAYVQAVAELGHPPRTLDDDGLLSPQLACWFDGLSVPRVRFQPELRPPWTASTPLSLRDACSNLSPEHDGAQYHAMQPPLYYELEQLPYRAAHGAPLSTRILLMRLCSVLLLVATAVATYLLVREVVPGSRWAARLGGLAIALQPIVMFNAASVNPDAAMVLFTTLCLLVVARSWRRGFTWGRAIALGMAAGALLISKTNSLTVLPALVVLLAGLSLRRPWDRGTLQPQIVRGAVTVAIAAAWFAAYAVINAEFWDRGLTYRQGVLNGGGWNLPDLINRSWQFFFPPLPGTADLYPGFNPFVDQVLYGMTGRLGWWNDYGIPQPINVAVLVVGAMLLAAAAVYVVPRARRTPWPAAVATASLIVLLLALLAADYQFALGTGKSTIHNRHFFPAIAVWGLVVGCAVAAVPWRRRPLIAGLLAAAMLAHTAVAVAATISRFYL